MALVAATRKIYFAVIEPIRHSAVLGKMMLLLGFAFIFLTLNAPTAIAQTFTLKDIGSAGAAGTYSTGSGPPPTYTVGGAGSGIAGSGTTDSFAFVNVATSGNIELQGKVSALGSTSSTSFGGFVIRDSYSGANAATAAIYVTASGGVKFTSRVRGNNAVTVNGSSSAVPVYLRLTKNGNTYSGWESPNGYSWTLVGSLTQASLIPQSYFAGFASSSTVSGTLNSATFTNFSYMTSVPQQESSLVGWWRSDLGVTDSSGVTTWADQSGLGNDGSQSTSSQKPALVTGAVNNSILPSISFDGVDDRLSLPTDFADLTAGASCFICLKPNSSSGTRTAITVGNASDADSFTATTSNTNATLTAYNNTTSSSVSTTSNPITVGQYHILELTYQPDATNGTGTIYVNNVQAVQATNLVSTLRNVSRTSNFIGMAIAGNNFFSGEIAEIIVYKTIVSSTQRASIESYLLSKFNLGTQQTLAPPVVTPGSAVLTPYQTVTMSQSQGAVLYYSLDGSTPSNNGNYPFYNGEAITIPATATLNVVAVAPFFNNSSTSVAYRVDPSSMAIPRNGLVTWLMANDGIVLSGGSVSQWSDRSGNLNDAAQSNATNRPGYSTSAINNLPAVSFNGSNQFLSLPSGYSSLASGTSIFLVVRPNSVSAGARMIDLGNGATSDNINIQEPTSTGASFYVYNGSSPSSVTSSNAITLGQFQLLEITHDGSTTATISTNSVQGASSNSMNSINSVVRTNNYIGQGSAGGNYFNGSLAECLIYNRAVTSLEKAAIEAFLITKYQGLTAIACPAPIISVPTSTLPGPTQVAISAPAGAVTHVTTDGTTPSTSSPIYSSPLNIYFTQTVKAISVLKGVQSAVSSATYTLSSTDWPAPSATDPTALDIQLQLPAPAIP